MLSTCFYARCMSTLQIRNVPDDLHRQLKARAAMEGMSISDYLLAEVERVLERPTRRELSDRVRSRTAVSSDLDPAADVRSERDSR